MLARRLASGDLKPLTRQLVFLIAPNYNADGNEKVNVDEPHRAERPGRRRRHARERQGPRSQPRLHEARHRRGALARRPDEQVGSARARRSPHHQRLVSRQPPDLFADPQSERGPAADRVHARRGCWRRSAPPCSRTTTGAPITTATSRPKTAAAARTRASIPPIPATSPGGPSIIARASATTTPACAIASRSCRRPTAISISRAASRSPRISSRRSTGRVPPTRKQIMTLTAQADRVVHGPGERQARRARRGFRDPHAAGARSRSSSATSPSCSNPKSGREMLAMSRHGRAGVDEGLRHLRRHAIAGAAEGLDDPAERSPRARGSRPRSIACAGTASRSRNSRTTRSWRWSASRSRTSRRRRRPFQGHQEARLKGAFDQAQLTVERRLALHSRRTNRWRGWRSTCSSPRATMGW